MKPVTADIEDFYSIAARDKLGINVPVHPGVAAETACLLDLLQELQVKATCFVVGRLGLEQPQVVRDILARGHEVASHGFDHIRIQRLTPQGFAADLRKSLLVLQNITGEPVVGFRAPAFSLRPEQAWAFRTMAEEGLVYDSSIRVVWPFGMRAAEVGVSNAAVYGIQEHPSFALGWRGLRVPLAGGGGLRALPHTVTRWAMLQIERVGFAVPVYFHPYDLNLERYRGWPESHWSKRWRLRWFELTQRFGRPHVAPRLRRLLAAHLTSGGAARNNGCANSHSQDALRGVPGA